MSFLCILLDLYLLFLHNPATYILTHPWQSNHCSISASIPQHNHLTFCSLLIPPLATTAHTPPSALGQTSTSPAHRLHPRPTILKTFSIQSLPMQTTIFSITNKANLDIYKPSAPTAPFIHGDDVIGELYQKNMVLFPFTIDLWAWFGPMLQAFLTTTHHPHQKPWRTTHSNNKYHCTRTRLPTTMPTWDPHISRPPMESICLANMLGVLWQLLHCYHTKST